MTTFDSGNLTSEATPVQPAEQPNPSRVVQDIVPKTPKDFSSEESDIEHESSRKPKAPPNERSELA